MSRARPVITVVGSYVQDLIIRVDRMPIFGESVFGTDFYMGPGGKGSNQAVAMSRLGAEVHFVGAVGQDRFAETAFALFATEGVDAGCLRRTGHLPTAAGFAILGSSGQSACITDMGANRIVNARFVEEVEAQLAASDAVVAVLEIPLDGAAKAMELANKHGVLTILNPAPAVALSARILRNVDVLTPNETEVRLLLGLAPDHPAPTVELAEELHRRAGGALVVTLGDQGALVFRDVDRSARPSIPVNVVDTTGAGDAFNAGLAVALAEGMDLVEAVEFANCTGAMACTAIGCIPGLPDRDTVERLRQHHCARPFARERSS